MLAQIGIQVDVAILSDIELGEKVRLAQPISSVSATPSRSIRSDGSKNRYRSDAEFAGTGYADPEVDALIDEIEGQMVTYVRDALIEKVWRKVLRRRRVRPALSSDQCLGAARRSRSANLCHARRPAGVPRRALYDAAGSITRP
jgi:hypothetical protein